MEALGGRSCSNNNEIVLMQPGPLGFSCIYELTMSTMTKYTWSLDGNQTEYNTSAVNITIPSGSHQVTCSATIDVAGYLQTLGLPSNNSENCTCYETQTIDITVVGTFKQLVCHAVFILVRCKLHEYILYTLQSTSSLFIDPMIWVSKERSDRRDI